jgi:hypothetical protein
MFSEAGSVGASNRSHSGWTATATTPARIQSPVIQQRGEWIEHVINYQRNVMEFYGVSVENSF